MKQDREARSLAIQLLAKRNVGAALGERLLSDRLSPKDRELIIDVVAAELLENGFDADSEPTTYGHELEDLIDYLNRPNLSQPTVER